MEPDFYSLEFCSLSHCGISAQHLSTVYNNVPAPWGFDKIAVHGNPDSTYFSDDEGEYTPAEYLEKMLYLA